VDIVENVLGRVREVSGIVNASIVGGSTGQILGSVAADDPRAAIVAGAGTDVVRVVSVMTVLLGQDEELEDVVLTLSGSFHVLRPLPDAEGALLLVTLDRERTNLALARRQLRDVEAGLVA
jgi:hypothetical protein